MKRKFWVLGIVILFAAGLIAMGAAEKFHFLDTGKKEESLIYYTIGTPDKDLKEVNTKLNHLLGEKYGLSVDYRKLNWASYGEDITDILHARGKADIVFAAGVDQGDYQGNAKRGAWYPLDEYLCSENGKTLYEAVPEVLWEAVRIKGHIYGVPTNKELAVVQHWMYPKELVERYNIDITKLKKLEDLEPVFAMIKEKEPEYTVMQLDRNSNDFFALYGYEYLLDKSLPLMVKSLDDGMKVVNIFETEEAEEVMNTLRKYYKAGYINQDAAVRESGALQKGEKTFWKQAGGGPYAEQLWSEARGYEVVSEMVSESIITTEAAKSALMCVSSNTKEPEKACEFLKAVNTDPEVRNMLNYGIENEHYRLNMKGQVVPLKDTYQGIQYTQGNWFILYTRDGEPLEKWEEYRTFNNSAVPSKILGFCVDTTGMEDKIAKVKGVWEKYYSSLMTGSVDTKSNLPRFIEELKEVGIDEIKEEFQKQLDLWKTEEKHAGASENEVHR